jgi:hypothetical protein
MFDLDKTPYYISPDLKLHYWMTSRKNFRISVIYLVPCFALKQNATENGSICS